MSDSDELEPIELEQAKELLKLLMAEGERLLRENIDDLGEFVHWLRLSFTALEPIPDYQQHFRLKCGPCKRSADARLREGLYILRYAVRKMDNLDEPGLTDLSDSYRRLIGSIPD